MKKLLSLLSVLTISGAAVPTTIAAIPYQKEKSTLKRVKRSIDEETQIPLPEIENVRRENQITLTRNDINIINLPEWNSTNFIIQLTSDIVRRIGSALSREQIISLLSTYVGSLTADFCSTYLGFSFANTVGAFAGTSVSYCMQTQVFRNLIERITNTIIEMNSGLINISSFFVPVSLNSPFSNSQIVYSPIYNRQYDEESIIEFAGRRVQRPSLTSLENWSNYEVRINMSILERTTERIETITIVDKSNLASLTFKKEL